MPPVLFFSSAFRGEVVFVLCAVFALSAFVFAFVGAGGAGGFCTVAFGGTTGAGGAGGFCGVTTRAGGAGGFPKYSIALASSRTS